MRKPGWAKSFIFFLLAGANVGAALAQPVLVASGSGSEPAPIAIEPAAGSAPSAAKPTLSRSPLSAARNLPPGAFSADYAAGTALAQVAALSAAGALRATVAQSLLFVPAAGTAEPQVALDSEDFAVLPLIGRAWQTAAADPSPAHGSTPTSDIATERISAEPPAAFRMEALVVDGMSTRLAFGATGTGRASNTESALIGPGSSDLALRRVLSAAGTDAGGAAQLRDHMQVETRRGADSLRGQAQLFMRQRLFAAQNPFAQWVRQTAPSQPGFVPTFAGSPFTPQDRELFGGLNLGGRVPSSRAYWFTALEGALRNDPAVATVRHPENFFAQPTNDEMQVLSARLGLSAADPVSAGVAVYSTVLQSLDSLLGPTPRTATRGNFFARVDWALGARHHFALESTWSGRSAPGGGFTRTNENLGARSFGSSDIAERWLLGRWEYVPNVHLALVTQGALGRHERTMPAVVPSAYEQQFQLTTAHTLPQISIDSRDGFTIGNPARFGPGSYPDEHLYRGQEQLVWSRGRYLIRAGLELSHNTDVSSFLRNQAGTYTYSRLENYISDALAFAAYGVNGQLNPYDQHNCDQTGKAWRDTAGQLHGLGYLPCYSHYTQTIGPAEWRVRTNDWAGFVSIQVQPLPHVLTSLALRWQRQQAPPLIALLDNPELPLTEHTPDLGNQWAPQFGLSVGSGRGHAPVLHLGYGIVVGRTANALFLSALTRTGSPKGDRSFLLRPTDNLTAGGAPPFPYVLNGAPGATVLPDVAAFAPDFRDPQVHQAAASLEETLPGHVHVTAGALIALGRHLPVVLDTNLDPAVNPGAITYAVVDGNGSGPLSSPILTVPFYASWPTITGAGGRLNPAYRQIDELFSRANSTYEAGFLQLTRTVRTGVTVRARYTFAHTADWNPTDTLSSIEPTVFDPTDPRAEYGVSDLDLRHSLTAALAWQPRLKRRGTLGFIVNGWRFSTLGSLRSGAPYTMRASGTLARDFTASGALIAALAPGINGYGGDSRIPGVGRNTYRYPGTWKADLRIARRFDLGETRELELLAESFNLLNHQNVTELETVGYTIDSGTPSGQLPRLTFLTGLKSGQTEFGKPLNVNATDFFRPRQFDFGLRFRF